MKIYVCARWARRDEARRFAEWVRLYLPGYAVNSGWLFSREKVDGELTGEQKRLAAERDLADLAVADVVVAFTEGPDPVAGGQRGGRHVELGAALALGKRVFVVGPRENIFCWLPVALFTWCMVSCGVLRSDRNRPEKRRGTLTYNIKRGVRQVERYREVVAILDREGAT